MLKTSRLPVLFAACAIAGLSCSSSVAAPPDPAPPRSAASLDDEDRPKIRPAVHHVKPTDEQRDIKALRDEVQLLRAEVAMCRDGSGASRKAARSP